VLNNVIVAGLQGLNIDPLIGKIVAIVFIAAWNYILYHKVIFVGQKGKT
jgi:hypothetical protein